MSIKAIPLLFLSLILYNALVFFSFSGSPPEEIFYGKAVLDTATNTATIAGSEIITLPMPMGGTWRFTLGDLVLFVSIVLLGIEVVKATYTRGAALVDNALSMILFVIFLVEFLLVDKASTSLFFFLLMLSGFDVIVGSFVSVRTARRDIGFGTGGEH